MRFFKIKPNLWALFLCTLLIMNPISAVPPQELYGEPCQTYAILCIISFLMGTIVYVLIHKWCIYQPTLSSIPPVMDQESMEKELMEKLKIMVQKNHNQATRIHNSSSHNKKNLD